ncbi:hypothetical protein TBR22_A22200 [Luteitalea sp. TBR-22]|uniref:DUF4252 domain-containing protein n=1 Tax=Luteitalea sp. TBR-22 TaxID=2802971 RepID=UPI001AF50475|nr:DUF4252 domain-containing protein [Luteitalea sp. TBR-22]BCS32995.1 hypothetical protein TBR22_A22200 [Luteitalea sp. TBR-22]
MRRVIVMCVVLSGLLVAVPARGQQLQLPDLSRLSASATDVVDVSVDQALLGMAAAFMGNGPDDAQVKSLVSSLKGIYVKSFTFAKDGAFDPSLLEPVRRQLATGQWSRLMSAKSSKDGSDMAVYLWRNGDRPGGLAVLSVEPREVTVVNIVGSIDLAQLQALQGKFGVPDLELGDTKGPKGPKGPK